MRLNRDRCFREMRFTRLGLAAGPQALIWGVLVAAGYSGTCIAAPRAFTEPVTEFTVNSANTAVRFDPGVAAGPSGDFVVVWHESDDSGSHIKGRVLPPPGFLSSPEFRIGSLSDTGADSPSIETTGPGFVVTFQAYDRDGDGPGVIGVPLNSSGTPISEGFLVNTWTTGEQRSADIAPCPDGSFAVTFLDGSDGGFSGDGLDGDGTGVEMRRFNSVGMPVGDQFQVNQMTTGDQFGAHAACGADGGFLVVWTTESPDPGGLNIVGRRVGSSGSPEGEEFSVNTVTTGNHFVSDLKASPAGGFVVVYDVPDGGGVYGYNVRGRRFDSGGALLGQEFAVNSTTSGDQGFASISCAPTGEFTVVWTSAQSYGAGDIIGRRFGSDAAPLGAEFDVVVTEDNDRRPDVRIGPNGGTVVVWERAMGFSDTSILGLGTASMGGPVCGDGTPEDPEECDDGNTAALDGCDRSCRLEDMAAETLGEGGGAFGTDASGFLSGDPLNSTLSATRSGSFKITETSRQTADAVGFLFFGDEVVISGPAADPASDGPHELTFRISSEILPGELAFDRTQLFLGGEVIPPCDSPFSQAGPDPCVRERSEVAASSRAPRGDVSGVEIVALTSALGNWNFGRVIFACGDTNGDGNILAGDALDILLASVQLRKCPLSYCDTTGDGNLVASDALQALRRAVEPSTVLTCAPTG